MTKLSLPKSVKHPTPHHLFQSFVLVSGIGNI